MKKIAIIMGSDSDLPVVGKAADTLKEFGVPFEMHVFSAHRTPEAAAQFAKGAAECGGARGEHNASRYRNSGLLRKSRRY